MLDEPSDFGVGGISCSEQHNAKVELRSLRLLGISRKEFFVAINT